MKRAHFATLAPVCPVCLTQRQSESPLRLAEAYEGDAEDIEQGMIHCSSDACLREYPILDGIPILIADLRSYLSNHQTHLFWRWDLPEAIESLVGDAIGPGSAFNATRLHLSSYCWDHYGDLCEGIPQEDWIPGGVLRALELGLSSADLPSEGLILDAGCSVGRSSFELAARSGALVLGVDLNLSMLAIARRLLRTGKLSWPLRRVGVVYDRIEGAWEAAGRERVDFWCCDLMNPPFARDRFRLVSALNVLDCLGSPMSFLQEVERVLAPGSDLICGTPYDWSPSATPVESWIGGHSQRGAGGGSSEALLRSLLTDGAHTQSLGELAIVAERSDVPWQVRLHARSLMSYRLHLFIARKKARGG